jgi:MFS family permease
MTTEPEAQKASRGEDAGIWITIRESPLPVKAMLGGVFVNKLGGFILVFLVLFLIHRGFSAVEAGAALSGYGGGAVLGILVGGLLSDRLGPRLATVISMAGSGFLALSILYIHSYVALLVVVTAIGAVGQMYRPAAAALLSELTPKNRQVMIMAMYRLVLNVGTTAAPLMGAALVAVSWNLLFWGEAVTDLGYAVIALFAIPRHRSSAEQKAVAESRGRQWLGGFLAALADRRFALYLLALFINALVYLQYQSALPLAMRAAGLATIWYAAMATINGSIVISCELLMTKVTQRLQPRYVLMAGFVLLGAGMSLYSVPAGLTIFIAGTLTWTLGEIVAGPTVFAYPAMVAPEGMRARYLGASQAVFALGTAIGPVAGVTVWHVFGRTVWLCCGAACLIGLVSARFSMRIIPRAASDGATPGGPTPGGATSDGAAAAGVTSGEVTPDAATP